MPEEGPNGSFPFLFVVAMASFLATLLFAALTDQKLLPLYTARRAIFPAAGSAALGSALLGWNAFGLAETPGIALPSSAMLGIGGALITLFWGTAFSRHDALTISMNASFACATALVVYTCALQALPTPWAGMVETALPALGAPLLWKLTPTSYAVRHEIPIFDPLPVNKASFAARLAFPLVDVYKRQHQMTAHCKRRMRKPNEPFTPSADQAPSRRVTAPPRAGDAALHGGGTVRQMCIRDRRISLLPLLPTTPITFPPSTTRRVPSVSKR